MGELERTKFIALLGSIQRTGIRDLIDYLNESDFFEAPASTKFHGASPGALLTHSLNTYEIFKHKVEYYKGQLYVKNIDISRDSIIICSLLHDLCKIGVYYEYDGQIKYDRDKIRQGHAKRSLEIINKFIQLTEQEKLIIKYHMGFFGSEVIPWAQEYTSGEFMDAVNKNPLVLLFHHADDEESKFMG